MRSRYCYYYNHANAHTHTSPHSHASHTHLSSSPVFSFLSLLSSLRRSTKSRRSSRISSQRTRTSSSALQLMTHTAMRYVSRGSHTLHCVQGLTHTPLSTRNATLTPLLLSTAISLTAAAVPLSVRVLLLLLLLTGGGDSRRDELRHTRGAADELCTAGAAGAAGAMRSQWGHSHTPFPSLFFIYAHTSTHLLLQVPYSQWQAPPPKRKGFFNRF